MTICIAAIGIQDREEFIVFATDHMITTGSGQFEHAIAKYRTLNSNTVGMIAGQALLFDDLTIIDSSKPSTSEQIKNQIFQNFIEKKKQILINQILNTYGVDDSFVKEALQKPIPNPFVQTILQSIADFKLGTSILFAGFKNSNAIISEINEDGIFDFRTINFHAIGSGSTQALNTMLFQKHSKSDDFNTTLYNVYKAKRNAEVMQGVGKETDLLILKISGLTKVSEQNIKILQEIYQEELDLGKNSPKLKKLRWD